MIYLRFGDEKHIDDLLDNGTIYCNSIKHFTDVEKHNPEVNPFLRYDPDELVYNMENIPDGTVSFEIDDQKSSIAYKKPYW